jgi:hypothetical protein
MKASAVGYAENPSNKPPNTSGPYSLLAGTPLQATAGAWALLGILAVGAFTLAHRRALGASAASGRESAAFDDTLLFPFVAAGALIQLKAYDNAVFLPAFVVLLIRRWRSVLAYAPGLVAVWRPNNWVGPLERLTHGAVHLTGSQLMTLGGLYLLAALLFHAALRAGARDGRGLTSPGHPESASSPSASESAVPGSPRPAAR